MHIPILDQKRMARPWVVRASRPGPRRSDLSQAYWINLNSLPSMEALGISDAESGVGEWNGGALLRSGRNDLRTYLHDSRFIPALLLAVISFIGEFKFPGLTSLFFLAFGVVTSTIVLGRGYGLASGLILLLGNAAWAGSGALASAGMILALIITADTLAKDYMFKDIARSLFSGISLGLVGVAVEAPITVLTRDHEQVLRSAATFVTLTVHEAFASIVLAGTSSPALVIALAAVVLSALVRALPRSLFATYGWRAPRPPWE